MKAASFFTGCAGFDLGFEQAGIEIVFQCEKDRNCNQLLIGKYFQIERSDDIKTLESRNIPYADIYFGGFPCQDASVAGKRAGLAGDRTRLFFEFARLLEANRPKWFVLENVPGILSSGKRQDFKHIIETLAQCGYYVSWRVLDSQYFGISQRRNRVFLVGCLGDWRSPVEVLFEKRIERSSTHKSQKMQLGIANKFDESSDEIIAVATSYLTSRSSGLFWQDLSPTLTTKRDSPFFLIGDRIRLLHPVEMERLQGFPDNWTEGFSDAVRCRMIGNAVSVPVAKFVGSRLVSASIRQAGMPRLAIADR